MINKVIPFETKLKLIHKFFTEVWHTDLIKDERPEPPTVEQMKNHIYKSTFSGLKLLEVEDWWHKARLFYYIGGDESMLQMEGDPDHEEEARAFLEMLDKEQDETFPKLIEKEYRGTVRDFDENSLIIYSETEDREIAFDIANIEEIKKFDLTHPLTVVTSKFIREDGSETSEKICMIGQEGKVDGR